MDFVMLTTLTDELIKGNRVSGSWLSKAYAHIVTALTDVGVSNVIEQNIKNRMKIAKEKFVEAYDLFNSLSSVFWNQMTKRFEAEEEVWEDFIRDKPQAVKWKTMQIRHYDLLKGLFGADCASGKKALTGRKILHELEKETIDLNDGVKILL
ncbi:Myb/SANT-like domain [Sesbania bispinosa]|nr:Myb/SANT-like domain [Sesbania bispinosa]